MKTIRGNNGKKLIRFGHSPDADDAFMFYAIAKGKIDTGDFYLEHVVEDIESLNRRALRGELEVTAISLHAYAYASDRYAILTSGASIGFNYGPLIVTRDSLLAPERLSGKRIAVPGEMTTAFLLLKLFEPQIRYVTVPFDRVFETVEKGEADAGLVIHEGQLTYGEARFRKVLDLGEWWYRETKLPLPLGLDAVRKDLGPVAAECLGRILKDSIRYALDHRQDAIRYALPFGRGIDPATADRFVGMYVNERTLELGEEDKRAIGALLRMAHEKQIIPRAVVPDFIEV
ncbi:MAG TPA: ABC transporter substrate-binding protein [Candidatus Omnitrophota bacterium]|nr:ABC transporter substrate-binding protein [Candidatus Omnitrophota bacterium]